MKDTHFRQCFTLSILLTLCHAARKKQTLVFFQGKRVKILKIECFRWWVVDLCNSPQQEISELGQKFQSQGKEERGKWR